ncbi:prefoldin alpha subunit family protein [Cavenderia fasciculata]|uniref:Prefoldin alpha subunit family protein n=1 Tax=Cavenderia fasciculata TaxID=261658 RepID=F4PKM5_CACFS|nr:prefoldin alpha subunit family protein [Cavenderia fasciculata]EGG24149.1 prefoldin alpha subunit family protein [Cavenderia fasciculata]|eukprot:XP_004362000.1 prefoldin alpha subunit family protein [Cavenderia fasciculata]
MVKAPHNHHDHDHHHGHQHGHQHGHHQHSNSSSGPSPIQQLTSAQLQRERVESIEHYKHFITDTLLVDLETFEEKKEELAIELEGYLELKSNIELMIENDMKELKTMMNIGSECYVKAKVYDTSKIFVNIGMGVSVQYTLGEAIEFINKKEDYLNQHIEKYTKKVHSIRGKISLIEKGINDLASLKDLVCYNQLISKDCIELISSSIARIFLITCWTLSIMNQARFIILSDFGMDQDVPTPNWFEKMKIND